MEIDSDGSEILDRTECLRLLGGRSVGRIGGTSGALPVVLPVDYAMDGESIVVETGRGTILGFATTGAVVAFEVDNLHETGCSGWTVMVTGVAEEVSDLIEIESLRSLLAGSIHGRDERFIRISSEIVSGRRSRHHRTRPRNRAATRTPVAG
jgi:nitroimidazol reductase NimA-like FMN-containing flavoprotein (pyridoxamine 5'-phosphate oxidase superfamily)